MTTEIATREQQGAAILERVLVAGDLSKLTPQDRITYYRRTCESLGLNPLSRPFDYITLSGRLTLYAKRDATDQLRKLHGVSINRLEREVTEGLYVVTAHATDATGRTDTSTGAVAIENLRGEARANAIMKAETKAKRRVTLSICGLGWLDETEADAAPTAKPVSVDAETGEIMDAAPVDDAADRLLVQIRECSDALGLTKDERRQAWNDHIGAGIKPAQASEPKLTALLTTLRQRLEEFDRREDGAA
jgi:hypothetical protein